MQEIKQKFKDILEPELSKLGFQKLTINSDTLTSTFLYSNGKIYFAYDYDWRDQYHEISLGKLYWFKDFMKRAVVIGDYSSYDNSFNPHELPHSEIFKHISKSLKGSINKYETSYQEIYSAYIKKREDIGVNIKDHVLAEVVPNELE